MDSATRDAEGLTEAVRESYLAIADRAASIRERNTRFLGRQKSESFPPATEGKEAVARRSGVDSVNRSAGRTIEAVRRSYQDIADNASALRERNVRFLGATKK